MNFPTSICCKASASILVMLAIVMGLVGSSAATELDMLQLPVSSPHLCFSCHSVNSPSPGDSDLNPFGLDFLENGRVWDSNLAQLNSDGDACLNGVEVGDSDGDGQPDGNVDEQSGNPGVADECGSSNLVDEKTWDALKAMFDGN